MYPHTRGTGTGPGSTARNVLMGVFYRVGQLLWGMIGQLILGQSPMEKTDYGGFSTAKDIFTGVL